MFEYIYINLIPVLFMGEIHSLIAELLSEATRRTFAQEMIVKKYYTTPSK